MHRARATSKCCQIPLAIRDYRKDVTFSLIANQGCPQYVAYPLSVVSNDVEELCLHLREVQKKIFSEQQQNPKQHKNILVTVL